VRATGDGGGSGQPMQMAVTINAVDAKSFQDLVRRNPDAVTGVFKQALRSGDRELMGMVGV